jgi:hypothetical protein
MAPWDLTAGRGGLLAEAEQKPPIQPSFILLDLEPLLASLVVLISGASAMLGSDLSPNQFEHKWRKVERELEASSALEMLRKPRHTFGSSKNLSISYNN